MTGCFQEINKILNKYLQKWKFLFPGIENYKKIKQLVKSLCGQRKIWLALAWKLEINLSECSGVINQCSDSSSSGWSVNTRQLSWGAEPHQTPGLHKRCFIILTIVNRGDWLWKPSSFDMDNSDSKASLKRQKSPETTTDTQGMSKFYWFYV